jgi:hypothetical protein
MQSELTLWVASKGFWQRCHWACGLCPSSGLLIVRKYSISETGSASALRQGQLCPLERANLNHWLILLGTLERANLSHWTTLLGPLERANLNHWITLLGPSERPNLNHRITLVCPLERANLEHWITLFGPLERANLNHWITQIGPLERANINHWITLLGPLERANLSHWITLLCPLEETNLDRWYSFRNVVFFSYLEFRTMCKAQKQSESERNSRDFSGVFRSRTDCVQGYRIRLFSGEA